MKTTKTMMSLLLLSAVCITPAYANWFTNHRSNMMLNIGSAPNPTPADLKAIGDSANNAAPARERLSSDDGYAAPQAYAPQPAAYVAPKKAVHSDGKQALMRMEGKTVYGAHGARLGSILAVDLGSKKAEVQLPSGIAVAMPASLLTDKGKRVVAPTMSPLDMMAMAKSQTGRTVAINIDTRHMRSRTSRG